MDVKGAERGPLTGTGLFLRFLFPKDAVAADVTTLPYTVGKGEWSPISQSEPHKIWRHFLKIPLEMFQEVASFTSNSVTMMSHLRWLQGE